MVCIRNNVIALLILSIFTTGVFAGAMHKAAARGQIDKLNEMLLENPDLDNRCYHGWTALHWAAYEGQEDVVELLCAQDGINLNAEGQNIGERPVHLASESDYPDVIAVLVGKGADLNIADRVGRSPLHMAAEYNSFLAAKVLIANNIKIEMQDKFGQTALHIAAYKGARDTVSVLLDSGAMVNVKTNQGYTSLHMAVFSGDLRTVEMLVDAGTDASLGDDNDKKPIDYAEERIGGEIAELLKNGTKYDLLKKASKKDVKKMVADGTIPSEKEVLYWSAERGLVNVIEVLLDKTAVQVDAKDDSGMTALHAAVVNGQMSVVSLLVSKGANVNEAADGNKTALHIAAEKGDTAMVQMLMDSGADINAQTVTDKVSASWFRKEKKSDPDKTALYLAAAAGHKDVVEVLIEKGADINLKDASGKTAADAADSGENWRIVKMIGCRKL